MTYAPIVGDCKTITRLYKGEVENLTEATISLKRTIWSAHIGGCGAYAFTEGSFKLKLEGQ